MRAILSYFLYVLYTLTAYCPERLPACLVMRVNKGLQLVPRGCGGSGNDRDRVAEWCHFNPSNGSFVLYHLFMKRNDFSTILM